MHSEEWLFKERTKHREREFLLVLMHTVLLSERLVIVDSKENSLFLFSNKTLRNSSQCFVAAPPSPVSRNHMIDCRQPQLCVEAVYGRCVQCTVHRLVMLHSYNYEQMPNKSLTLRLQTVTYSTWRQNRKSLHRQTDGWVHYQTDYLPTWVSPDLTHNADRVTNRLRTLFVLFLALKIKYDCFKFRPGILLKTLFAKREKSFFVWNHLGLHNESHFLYKIKGVSSPKLANFWRKFEFFNFEKLLQSLYRNTFDLKESLNFENWLAKS